VERDRKTRIKTITLEGPFLMTGLGDDAIGGKSSLIEKKKVQLGGRREAEDTQEKDIATKGEKLLKMHT